MLEALRKIVKDSKAALETLKSESLTGPLRKRVDAVQQSGLFDVIWYAEQQGIEAADPAAVVAHYLTAGHLEGHEPHPLFDSAWYVAQIRDGKASDLSALEHYLRFGAARALSPSPLFDVAWYRKKAGAQLPPNEDPFRHFLKEGAVAAISPHPLFDSAYYLSQERQLASAGVNPLTHFVGCGALQGKNPNPFFDSGWYLKDKADLLGKGINPLAHFIMEGAEAGAQPHPDLDLDIYILQTEGAPKDRLAAFIHLVRNPSTAKKINGTATPNILKPREDRPAARLEGVDLNGFGRYVTPKDRPPPVADDGPPLDSLLPSADTKLMSFDVWDTLLRRDCDPDEIKLQSARYLLVRALPETKPAFRTLTALYDARIFAENSSAPNDEFEFRFEEALDAWLEMVLVTGLPTSRRAEIRQEMIAHEMAAERRSTRADRTGREVLAKTKVPKIYASDFYMSSRFVDDLLAAHGMRQHFVRGFVSSNTYETKRSGKMFDRILTDMEVAPSSVLHIGDNERADVQVPASKGIKTAHYVSKSEIVRRQWFHDAFAALKRNDPGIHERRIAALVEDIASGLKSAADPDDMASVGARLALLVVGYVLSAIEDAARSKVDRIHYFTREGQFFREVHDALVAADPYNMSYPGSELLEVSRRATFAASLPGLTSAALMRLWTLYSRQSPQGLAASLNLDDTSAARLASQHGLDYRTVVVYPWRDKAFMGFVNSAAFQELASARLAEQKRALLAYLGEKGVTDAQDLLICDVGWRGTIQDNLAHLLPRTTLRGHYIGLFKFLNPQPRNAHKTGWVFDEPAGRTSRIGDVAPLEMIFNGTGGSVIGYAEKNGAMTAVRQVFDGEEAVILGPVARLQKGVLAAVRPIADYVRLHGLTAGDLQHLGSMLAVALSRTPPAAVGDAFLALHHNETFGTGAVEEMAKETTLGDALSSGLKGSRLHAHVSRALASERWQEGALVSRDVKAWWERTPQTERCSAPSALSRVYAPASIRARNSKLAVFAPSPIRASGGHRTIFNCVRKLAQFGLEPIVFLEGIGSGVEVVEEYLAGTPASIHTQWHKHIPSDIAFATIAHSANFVAELRNTHHRGYLVQDFEALFNPMSDGYVIAENSYTQGLQHFTIGNWLTHVINTRYGAPSAPAGLGVDTAVYRPLVGASATGARTGASGTAGAAKDAPKRELAVCFLYQPDKPRRTPILGIEALRRVKRAMPEVKVYVFGSNLPLNLDFEVENLGLITDLTKLNALYNRCVAGLCVSGSNPSRIPYEMMAAGCIPVDLYRYNNLLDHQTGTILLAYQNAASIAKALLSILGDPAKARDMSASAIEFAKSRTLEWEVDVIANNLMALMDGDLPPLWPAPQPYDAPPVIATEYESEDAIRRFCEAQLKASRAGA